MGMITVWLGGGCLFSAGFVLGVVGITLATRRRDRHGEASKQTQISIDLLAQRNEIAKRQVETLELIAKSVKFGMGPRER